MPDYDAPCQILQAFIDTAGQRLQAAANMDDSMAARHTVNTVSKFTAAMLRLNKQHPEALAPAQPELDALIAEGKTISAAIPYRCQECGDIYQRQPPVSSTELCPFCYSESKEIPD